jgi:hypothetical protein
VPRMVIESSAHSISELSPVIAGSIIRKRPLVADRPARR